MLLNRKFAIVMGLVVITSAVVAACSSAPEGEIPVQTVEVKATDVAEERDETVGAVRVDATVVPPEMPRTYRVGIFGDISTTNYWASLDTETTVWNAYVLGNMHPSLYELAYPKNQYVPSLATKLPEPAVPEGDFWVTEATIQRDVKWSDGEEVTVRDLIFALETCLEFGLGGNWLTACQPDYLDHVEAVDDYRVKIYFSQAPDLSVWQLGVGLTPFMPEHFWADIVEACRGIGEAAACLYAADGAEEPSAGPFVFETWEPGAFVEITANPGYFLTGSTWTFYADGSFQEVNPTLGRELCVYGDCSGQVDLEYANGPFVSNVLYTVYDTQDAGTQALAGGQVDFLLNPLGLQRDLWEQVAGNTDLAAFQNPTNGFRYLAFNMRKSPNNYQEFRQAVATLVDREYLAGNVLQHAAIPTYALVPKQNAFWFNADVPSIGKGLTRQQRVEHAVELLKSAGFGWDVEPSFDEDSGMVVPGTTLKDPGGNELAEIELLAPGASYDSMRATASIWIAQWCNEIGIPVKANPTGFDTIIPRVFEPDPETGEIEFDWYILGWRLGNPTLPTFHESFLVCANDAQAGGFNTPGYCDAEFDEWAAGLLNAIDLEEARNHVWQMEAKLAGDLPYIPLFTAPILEFYAKTRVEYPFLDTLGGLAAQGGMPSRVIPK